MSKRNSLQSSPYKIVLIGDQSSGKTSFFNKVTSGIFRENCLSTIGMDKRTVFEVIKDGENKDLRVPVSLWDSAGQEKFREISACYVRGADGVILMFGIDSEDSMRNLKLWLDLIVKNIGDYKSSGNVVLKLIGNKEDLRGENNDFRMDVSKVENEIKGMGVDFEGFISVKLDSKEKLEAIINKMAQEIYEKKGLKNRKDVVTLQQDNNKEKRRFFC